jgi:hypothetical protein
MSTSRLQDYLSNIETKNFSVLNLDATLPASSSLVPVLETFLGKISEKRNVKTLSLRFNNLKGSAIEILIEWLVKNDSIETLYLMSTNIDSGSRQAVEDAWKRNLSCHHTDNFGFTFTRLSVIPTFDDLMPTTYLNICTLWNP